MFGKIKCPDNCGLDIDDKIKYIICKIEAEVGQELDISSGARCPAYNKTIKGSISGDAHELAKAVDVFVDFSTPAGRELGMKIVIAATKYGIKRIGIARSFIHIDCAETLPNPRMWLYF